MDENDETGKAPEAVDAEAVDVPDVEGSDTVETKPEKKTRKKATKKPALSDLARAQGKLGVAVTDVLDHRTKMTIRNHQRVNGLSPNGRLDAATRKSLGI